MKIMKIKLIFLSVLIFISSVSNTAVSAAWVFEETFADIPEEVNMFYINDNYISTYIDVHAISNGEDICRRYDGPSYIYDGNKLS